MQYFKKGPVGSKMYEGNYFIVKDKTGRKGIFRALADADMHKGGKKGTLFGQQKGVASVFEIPWELVVCRLYQMSKPKKMDGFTIFD